ncbi:MAG: HK97 family phage prohead protease [Oscillospiraceae bacterium]|nr:HK97 family phage prohead protease [Oscillospiraceae bacterium]
MNSNKELRSFNMQDLKSEENGTITGHAAVFDSKADIGGWWEETIARGAFDESDLSDVPLFKNHDTRGTPLARSRRNNGNSTMTIKIDGVGLYISANLDVENNLESKSVYSSVKRGDMNGMSFMFSVKEEKWSDLNTDYPKRTILKIEKVFEVSAVNFPAYKATDVQAASSVSDSSGVVDTMRDVLERAKKDFRQNSGLDLSIELAKSKAKYKI